MHLSIFYFLFLEFTREVSDTQMEHVAPVILPEMHRIFVQSDTYTIRTRARAVEIFNTCATLIYNIASMAKVIWISECYVWKFLMGGKIL